MGKDRRVGVMIQVTMQVANRSVHFQMLVDRQVVVPAIPSPDQTQLRIWILPCPANPRPVVKVSPRNPIGDRRSRLLEESLYLFAQFVRDTLVGVHNEYPVRRGLIHGEVLL